MVVDGKPYRSIWESPQGEIHFINQQLLPHRFVIEALHTPEDAAAAIKEMKVRGAPLIGVTAAYGVYLGVKAIPEYTPPDRAKALTLDTIAFLADTRPTGYNLHWALSRLKHIVEKADNLNRLKRDVLQQARQIAEEDVRICRNIGKHGLRLIEQIAKAKSGGVVNILTHCNAGWLACVDWGTALAPVYMAHDKGIAVHVWVDETRPRNQGASLTAWELLKHGIAHTVICDNAGGLLMMKNQVDLVITGTDCTTANGTVINKIGTYEKALAAHANNIPFYVALPTPTIAWHINDALNEVPIEERNPEEVMFMKGFDGEKTTRVKLTPEGSPAYNPAFDITPSRYISGLITEYGIFKASPEGMKSIKRKINARNR